MKKIKDSDFARMEKVYKPRNKYVEKGFNFYFSYSIRIMAMLLSIVVIALVSYRCFIESFSNGELRSLKYSEKGNVDYKVQLFENNPFETGDLNPTDSYISDLIDNISTDFNYDYVLDKEADIKYTYYIVATMELNDGTISKKEYPLMDKVTKELKNTKELKINQNINLDYDYYNNLAKGLKDKFGLNIEGSLKLNMYIDMEINYSQFKNINNKSQIIETEIPLLSSQVSVKMINEIDNEDEYLEEKKPELINKYTLYMGIGLLIIDTVFFLLAVGFIVRATPKKSKYCSLRDGLLRDYDKVIVNSKNLPKLDNYNVIDCYSFSELMDAQRLLGKPIIYHEIVKGQKCVFVIMSDKDVYKFVLKECDIEF